MLFGGAAHHCRLHDPTRRSDPNREPPSAIERINFTCIQGLASAHLSSCPGKVQDEVSVQLQHSETFSEPDAGSVPVHLGAQCWDLEILPPFFDFVCTSHRAWIAHEVATFPIMETLPRARLWFPCSPPRQSQAELRGQQR